MPSSFSYAGAELPLTQVAATANTVCILIGPEGGFSDIEYGDAQAVRIHGRFARPTSIANGICGTRSARGHAVIVGRLWLAADCSSHLEI